MLIVGELIRHYVPYRFVLVLGIRITDLFPDLPHVTMKHTLAQS